MAGDWIKMRGNLWDDPRIAKMCDLTDQSEAAVVGGLYWLWAAADQHTEDGVMRGMSLASVNRKVGIKGFGEALVAIGWVADHPDGIRVINFEEHNGASAKKRLETAKRVALHRNVTKEQPAPSADEKRRANIPSAIKKLVLARDGRCCVYCNREGGVLFQTDTKADGYIHLDHVIPLSRGGLNDETNIVASCRECNMRKGNKTPSEAGMPWPVSQGIMLGNSISLQEQHESVTDALAREEKEKEKNKEELLTHTENNLAIPTQAGAVCVLLKSKGFGSVNPSHQGLIDLLNAGATIGIFDAAADTAKEKNKDFAYVLGIVKRQMKSSADLAAQPRASPMQNETNYQKSVRERVAEFAPGVAKQNIEVLNVIAA